MRTIFDYNTCLELIDRIDKLSGQSKAGWGKMNIYQMLKHCTMSEEMILGKKPYKRLFIGRLFGKIALSTVLKGDGPMKKSQPTHPELKIKGNGNVEAQKQKWISLLKEYASYGNTNYIHPFFGKMTLDQIGQFVYKHTDHHLRQFGQ